MWLRLAFRQSLKISSTWDTKNFMIFCIFYPKDYLGYFVLGQFRFAHHSKLFVKARHQMKVLLGFENFQIVAHELLGCQFLEKYRIFHLDKLMNKKKIQGILELLNMLFLDTFPGALSEYIYIILNGYKLFLTSYVGLKIKKNVIFLQFLCFFHFPPL